MTSSLFSVPPFAVEVHALVYGDLTARGMAGGLAGLYQVSADACCSNGSNAKMLFMVAVNVGVDVCLLMSERWVGEERYTSSATWGRHI